MAKAKTSESNGKGNSSGLPDQLKQGIERLTGCPTDDVKVHCNSPKPAQLDAHGGVQGSDIHAAPDSEKQIPAEAWHVVQQQDGRVRPAMQLKAGVAFNDDPALEREADALGAAVLE